MKLKQSRIGRTYIRLVTKSSFFFPGFVLIGVAIILFITINTKIDVIKTYQMNIGKNGSEYALFFDNQINSPSINKIFIYETKNEAVYQVNNVVNITKSTKGSISSKTELSFDLSSSDDIALKEFLKKHIGTQVKADIPIKKISLLERIFTKGGMKN